MKPEEELAMLKNKSAAEQIPELGTLLRARRKELGLTMQAVADAAGLSTGFISQIERGLTAPSLASLAGISEILETPMSTFLSQPEAEDTSRQASRVSYSVPGADVSYERVSTTFPGSQLHSVIVHEPPGHRSEPISHKGEEIFFILAGEITVEIEGKRTVMTVGDTIHFDSTRVHSTWNHGTETASFLWCGTMDVFGEAPAPIHKISSLGGGAHSKPKGSKKK